MKKLLIITIGFLSLGLASVANTTGSPTSYSRPVDHITRGSYHSIKVYNDIDVVLTESNLAGITIVADDKVNKDIKFTIKNGVLNIYSKKGSLKKKAIVYVPVSNLSRLEINGDSHVVSAGFLNTPTLNVYINGESTFNIRNRGDVIIHNSLDIELTMDKSFASKNM